MTPVRPWKPCASITFAVVVAACGEGAPDGDDPVTVRDSAGIEIVENRVALDELPEWRPGEPELRIGTLEGDPEYQLYRVRDATRLPDGRIVVVNSGTAEVRVYEPDGTFALSFGGEGEGPEEFGDIRGVDVVGDSLLAFDARSSRVSTWSTDGELLGSVTLSAPVGRLTGHAWLAGGRLLLLDTPFDMVPEVGETIWWQLLVHRYTRDGTLRDTIVEYPAIHLVRLPHDRGDGIMLSAFHFTPIAKVAAAGDRVFGTDASDREIEELTSSGELRRLIRWTGPALAVEDGDYETYRDEVLTALEDPESEETRDRLDRTPAEPAYPGLQDLGVAADGSLWVRRYDRPGGDPGQRWLVFDTEGRLEGRIWLPDGLVLHDVGHDYLLGVETDELDVEYVALYGFHPPWFDR